MYIILNINNIAINKNKSLNLLNENALNAALKVPTLVDQKFIKKNDVSPINSQPKNITIRLPDDTNNIILIINKFKNNINLSTKGSYLKYENVYIYTNSPIVKVKNEKLIDTISIIISNDILYPAATLNHLPKLIVYDILFVNTKLK